jgi:hypothetical protein
MISLFSRKRYKDAGRIVVWDEHKLIYVRVPKSANSSIRKSIPDGIENRVDITQLKKLYPEYLSFSFVRNPWARLVSAYTEKIRVEGTEEEKFVGGVYRGLLALDSSFRVGMPFDEFAEITCSFSDQETEKHLKSQCYFLVRDGVVVPDFVGRIESMQQDWAHLANMAGFDASIGHWNKSRHAHYTEFYDDRLMNLVAERYREDIEVFGYEFGK